MKNIHKLLAIFVVICLFLSACVQSSEDSADSDVSITIETPEEGATVESPLQILGSAPGNWFFEAQAPVFLYAQNDGTLLAQGIATVVSDDWMSTDQVEFEATMNFEVSDTIYAYIILEKANPSGLPENDDSFKWDVSLKAS